MRPAPVTLRCDKRVSRGARAALRAVGIRTWSSNAVKAAPLYVVGTDMHELTVATLAAGAALKAAVTMDAQQARRLSSCHMRP